MKKTLKVLRLKVVCFLMLFIFSSLIFAGSREWNFESSTKHVFDTDKIEVCGGNARLCSVNNWFNPESVEAEELLRRMKEEINEE